jgi:hypothetical protein
MIDTCSFVAPLALRGCLSLAAAAPQGDVRVAMPVHQSDIGHILLSGNTVMVPPSDRSPSSMAVALRGPVRADGDGGRL